MHAEGVSKWYGQVSGLNNVTVSIPPGITGLLGPNGAGKSTFMTYFLAAEGRRLHGQTAPSELRDKFAMSLRQPIGVCSMITP